MSENQCLKSCVNRSSATVQDQCNASVSQQQPSGDEIAGPASEIEEELNNVYEKRLAEINEQANGDATLKEITYKEWISMLRQINKTLITNIQEIERETSSRLDLLQRKSSGNCRHEQVIELCKYRKDIESLVHLIRNGRQNGDWSLKGMNFETITEQDIVGEISCCESNIKKEPDSNKQSPSTDPKSCAFQKSKLMAHVKVLAYDIAERYDEIRDLKRQIITLEDDILNAQKKIQLKDDVIRELRNDLKAYPKSAAIWGRRASERLSPNDCYPLMSDVKMLEICDLESPDTPRADSYKNRDSINSLNLSEFNLSVRDEDDEEELFRCLKDELAQFFELQETHDQNMGNQKLAFQQLQPRINELVDKLLKANCDQQNKLRFYRRELLNLENPQSKRTIIDEDSGISSDIESDAKIVNAVRSRISCLVEENHKLQKHEQCLKIENEDFKSQVKAKSALLDKTAKALREVADFVSLALSKPIYYEDIFESTSKMTNNPIVDAFTELIDILTERDKTINDLQKQIEDRGRSNRELQANSENLEDELCELKKSISMHTQCEKREKLFQNKEFSRLLVKKADKHLDESLDKPSGGHHSEYLRIIDDLSSDLSTLSCQVNMVQNEFLNDKIAERFEGSLKRLEAQNDLLQAAIDSLVEEKGAVERTLKTKNEHFKNTVCCLEEKIWDLENTIDELQSRPCQRCESSARFEDSQKNLRQRPQRTKSDERLEQIKSELKRKCKIVENLKSENAELQRELTDIRINQAKVKLLQRREATPDKKFNQEELLSKLNTAQEKNSELIKSVQKTAKQIASLQNDNEELQEKEKVNKKERDLLKTELISLKETQASQMGIQHSLKDQLHRTTTELYAAKEKLFECSRKNEHLEKMFHDETNRLKKDKNEILTKHNNLVEEFNEMLQEYQKLEQILDERNKLIAAYESWKEEQIHMENEMRQKTQLFENHIRQMLTDKQKLLDQLNESESVNHILKQTLENSKLYTGNQSSSASGLMKGYKTSVANFTGDPVSNVIENVRHTSRKLSQQRSMLEDEAQFMSK